MFTRSFLLQRQTGYCVFNELFSIHQLRKLSLKVQQFWNDLSDLEMHINECSNFCHWY